VRWEHVYAIDEDALDENCVDATTSPFVYDGRWRWIVANVICPKCSQQFDPSITR
jgi:hypothetical protein